MRHIFLSIIVTIAIVLGMCSCSNNRPRETEFVFLYSEGLYNFVFPYDFKTGQSRPGQANFMSMVRQQRAIYKDHCIVLDCGNRLLGALPSRYNAHIDTLAEPVSFKADRLVNYDATGIGRTDLESDLVLNSKVWNEANQPPFICANMVNRKDGRPFFKPYIIFERDGIRIAVFAMTSPSVTKWLPTDMWKSVEIQDMIECAQQWMPHIQAENPDFVIGLFDCNMNYEGRGVDIDTYKNPNGGIPAAIRVPGFDLLLMGDTDKAEVQHITDDAGRRVTCMTVGEAAKYAGLIHVHFSKQSGDVYQTRIFASTPELNQYMPDHDFMEKLKPDFDKVYNWLHTPIGYLKDTICGWKGFFEPDEYRELINKAQMWQIPEADIAMSSCFICKDTIFPGLITPFLIQKIYPYENHIKTIYMTGDDVVRFLEWAVNMQFVTMTDGNSEFLRLHHDQKGHLMYNDDGMTFLEVSPSYFTSARGIRYQIDLTKGYGNRVKVLSMSDGRPFVPSQRYLVAINSHQANGGGGFFSEGLGWDEETLSLHIVPREQKSERFILYDYIRAQEGDTLSLTLDHNWEIVPSSWWSKARSKDKDWGNNLPLW